MKDDFQNFLAKWDEFGDKEKIKTPISVPDHYKKYMIEEQKIVLKKLNIENATLKTYDGLEDAKKIDLANPREDL